MRVCTYVLLLLPVLAAAALPVLTLALGLLAPFLIHNLDIRLGEETSSSSNTSLPPSLSNVLHDRLCARVCV